MTLTAALPEYDPSYGFCLFRIPTQGGRVIWEVTNTCNYGCRYCIFSSTSRQQKDELNTVQALNVIDDLKTAGFTHVKITGGEPFMRPDIMQIIRHARAEDMTVDISTNAAYITDEMAAELATLGLEMVHVSLDGPTQHLQETVRGKRTFAPTITGLQALTREKIHVRIGCVLYKENQNALQEMVDFCHGLGVSEVIFSLMEPVGRLKKGKQSDLLCDRDAGSIQAEIAGLARDYAGKIAVKGNFAETIKSGGCGTCPGGDKFLFIDHKGRVSPCTWVSERAPQHIASETLHDRRLSDILRGRQIAGFRQRISAVRTNRCPMQDIPLFDATEKISALFSGDIETTMAAQPKFSETGRMYRMTTENLSAAFAAFDLKGKNVLTVNGSGDQILNAAGYGATAITAFDINYLSQYIAMLKLAACRKMGRDAFILFLHQMPFDIYRSLRDGLPTEARFFWDKAYAAFGNDGTALAGSGLFHTPASSVEKNNAFVQDIIYARAGKISPTYIQSDILSLPQKLTGKMFDFIWLSNIADYAHKMLDGDYLSAFRDKAVTPLLSHLAPGGTFAMAYIYDSLDRNKSSQRSDLNIAARRRQVFAAPTGFRYREIQVTGAVEADNPDTIMVWEADNAG